MKTSSGNDNGSLCQGTKLLHSLFILETKRSTEVCPNILMIFVNMLSLNSHSACIQASVSACKLSAHAI